MEEGEFLENRVSELWHWGREVLIKSILRPIPAYVMSLFRLPSSLCDVIHKMLTLSFGHQIIVIEEASIGLVGRSYACRKNMGKWASGTYMISTLLSLINNCRDSGYTRIA